MNNKIVVFLMLVLQPLQTSIGTVLSIYKGILTAVGRCMSVFDVVVKIFFNDDRGHAPWLKQKVLRPIL